MGRGSPICVRGFIYFLTGESVCITHTRCQYCEDRKALCGTPCTPVPGGVVFMRRSSTAVSSWEMQLEEHSMRLCATRWETHHEQWTRNFHHAQSTVTVCSIVLARWVLKRAECLLVLSTFFSPLFFVGSEKKTQLWLSYRLFNFHLSKSVMKKIHLWVKVLSHSIAGV